MEKIRFQIEKRVESRVQKWQEEMQEALKRQQEAAQFKARPADVLRKEPFQPKPSEKPLSEISNFELHSDRRAEEREAYEMHKKQREAELEGMKRQVSGGITEFSHLTLNSGNKSIWQLEDRKKMEEEDEVRRLRQETVHKPLPVKSFRPIEIQKSDKPITEPMSPKFSQLNATRKLEETRARQNL